MLSQETIFQRISSSELPRLLIRFHSFSVIFPFFFAIGKREVLEDGETTNIKLFYKVLPFLVLNFVGEI